MAQNMLRSKHSTTFRIAVLMALFVVALAAKHAKSPGPKAPDPCAELGTLDPPDASNGFNVDARERCAVSIVQRTSVHEIDSTLADMRFDDWFRSVVGPNARITWELNDCGETGCCPENPEDMPSCVQATATLPWGYSAYVELIVGNYLNEKGPPEFWSCGIEALEDSLSTDLGTLPRLQKWSRAHSDLTTKAE